MSVRILISNWFGVRCLGSNPDSTTSTTYLLFHFSNNIKWENSSYFMELSKSIYVCKMFGMGFYSYEILKKMIGDYSNDED